MLKHKTRKAAKVKKDPKVKKQTTLQNRNKLICLLYALLCFGIIFFLIAQDITPQRYDLYAGGISPATITSTKDIEDEITTDALREEEAKKISTVYTEDKDVTDQVKTNMTDAYAQLQQIAQKGADERQRIFLETGISPDTSSVTYSNAFVVNITAQMPVEANASETIDALNMSQSDIETMSAAVAEKVQEILGIGLKQQFLTTQKNNIIAEISQEYSGLPTALKDLTSKILSKYLAPNLLPDEAATLQAKEAARNSVEPVTFKKGASIVLEGEIVTAAQIQVLNNLGLLNDQAIDFELYFGAGLIVLILLALIGIYVILYEPELLMTPHKILMLCIILLLVVFLSMVSKTVNPMLLQVTLGTVLIAMLLHTRMALITNVSMSIITGMTVSDSSGVFSVNAITATIISIVAGTIAVYMCKKPMHRMRILLTGIMIGGVGVVVSIALGLIVSGNLMETLTNSLWVFAGGIVSAVFCIGSLPVWEAVFNVLTPTKLLEIANPNQPLLRRLAMEAPGTYHHSIVVANLAETAAEKINANVLLVRAGAYYHDVGKLRIPECYSENQNDFNKAFHSAMTPEESAAAIRTHTTEGMELAQKYKLPSEIIDIIIQHHGTNPIFYFYAKALEQNPDADMADYTYPGPKPQSKEAGIIMLADSVEAAVRSSKEATPAMIQEQVEKIFSDRLRMGQLDECSLTMKQINIIRKTFIQVLSGVYHERIQYPEIDKKKLKLRKISTDEKKEEET